MTDVLSLVADIGGTNTRVALARGTDVDAQSIRRYSNADYPGLEPVLQRYLGDMGVAMVTGVCVAAAGPVRDGVATMTNLDWTITGAGLGAATGAGRVAILNDLQAQGYALGAIAPEFLRVVIPGPAPEGAAKLVVGVGTGMNAAPVHETPWGRYVAASECGHVSMPVRTEEDWRLAVWGETHGPAAHGFTGVEDVQAGRGLERLYAFAAHEAGRPADKKAAEVMADLAAGDPIARKAAGLWVHIFGQMLGNLALTHLPFGGIYIIGGVARALTPYLAEFGLTAHFRDKGRFAGFLENFSVTVIEDDFAALTGCAAYLTNGARG